jgi:glycosyltransferase involved in cell wall biosynthesis
MQIYNVCLTHDPAHGGLHRSVRDFSRALAAPILSLGAGGTESVDVEEGVSVCRIGCGTSWLFRDCRVMAPAVARQADAAVARADLLIVHSLFRGHAPWAQAWARRHGRRYWAVPHGCLDPWSLSHRGLLKRLWLEAYGRSYLADAERVLISSRRSLEKSLPWIPAERSTVVHWPVDLPTLAAKDAARGRFRQRCGVPEAARQLLFLGRLHAIKRPIETLRAFAAAVQAGSHENCHLVMAGMDGDLTQATVQAAVPAGVRDRVHLVGPLMGGAVADAMLASDGFISLSFQENFGYAAAEALAYGLPVILSPGHDLAHEMPARDGRFACGWLLGNNAEATAVAAIREFVAAPDATLAAAGAVGRAWVGEILSRDQFHDRLAALV